MTFKGHILSVLLTFRTFAAVLSRIAVLNTPGDPMRALLSSFRIGSGHRVIRTPLGIINTPQISSMRETNFDASSVRFRYGPPVCSPPALTGPAGLYVPASPLGLLLPGFQVTQVTPNACRI